MDCNAIWLKKSPDCVPKNNLGNFEKTLTNLVWNVGYIESNINKNSNFPFENLYNRYLGVINEFNCSESQRENCKKVFDNKQMEFEKINLIEPTSLNNNNLVNHLIEYIYKKMLQSTSSQHSHQSNQQHNINNNLDEIAERQLVRLGSELQESLTAFFNRILSKNKFLFNIRRLQGLIVHNSWSNGFGTEYENLRDVITNITRKYHNSSGIWGLHGANTRFAHIHWLHMCTSYSNGDCKCRITEYLRNNGYTIHWDKRYSQEGLTRRLAQSTIPTRTTIHMCPNRWKKTGFRRRTAGSN